MTKSGVSRRALLTGMSALPVLCAARAGMPLSDPLHPAPPDNAATSALAAKKSVHQHMILPVMVNGAGPFSFVVDSGADHSVLSDLVVQRLQPGMSREVLVEGVVRAVRVRSVHINRLSFGPFQAEDLTLPVLPEEWLGADGFLGLDLIARHRVTLDFSRQRFIVETPLSRWSPLPRSPRQEVILADGRHGHLRAGNCRVDGVRTAVFIDTGAEISVGNPALLAALTAQGDLAGKVGMADIHGVTGGTLRCRTIRFNRMQIQGLHFTDGTLGIADLHIFHVWGLGDRPALLIGMNFLRRFEAVSIDYGRKAFVFRLPEFSHANTDEIK